MSVALVLLSPYLARAIDVDFREAVYAIQLNGDLVADNAVLLEGKDGQIALGASDLQSWGVVLPKTPPVVVDGKPYYRLSDFPGASARVDEMAQRLDVTMPANAFTTLQLKTAGLTQTALSQVVPGYYVNYDLHAEAGKGSASNLLIDAGTQLGEGVLDNSLIAGQLGGYGDTSGPLQSSASTAESVALRRLSTQWRADDVNNHTSLTIGDAVSGPSAFADQVNFAGVGYSRNFTTEPWLSPQPLPSISGTANVPSQLDVYVDNVLAYSDQVDIGPFRVTSLPNVNGLGQVQMVLRNVQGGQEVVTGSYYTSNDLLAKGLSDFAYDAGFVNYNYGQLGSAYGEFVARSTQRYGLSNQSTLESFAEYAAHDAVLGVGDTALVGHSGVIEIAFAAGTSQQGGGLESIADYSFSSSRFGVGLQGKLSSTHFVLAGSLGNGLQRELLFYANGKLGRRTSVSASYGAGYVSSSYVNVAGSGAASAFLAYQRASTLTIHQGLGARSYLDIAGSQIGGTTNQSNLGAQLVWLVGPATEASTFAQSLNGSVQSGVSLSHSAATLGAMSYSAETAAGPGGYATVQTQAYGAHEVFDAGFSTGAGGSSAAADVSGAFVNVNGHNFLTQPVRDAYGAVVIEGYPNVPVFAANQPVGSTDKNGYAPLPLLVPYAANPVAIDPLALPFASNVEQTSRTTDPRYRLPVLVRFGSQRLGGIVVRLVGQSGNVLQSGTVRDSGGHEWPIGNDGLLYVGGLTAGAAVLTAEAGQTTCRFSITVPQNTSDIPYLGTALCR